MGIPYQSEETLVKFLDTLEDEASANKGDLDKHFSENLDLLRGRQWKGPESPMFLFNVISSSVEDKTGKLSESRPKINVFPTREGLGDAANLLGDTISALWDRHEIEYKTERLAMFMEVAGVGFVGTPFNRSLLNGVGDVDFVIKDPRMCGVDISVMETDKIDQGEYIILEDFLALDSLKFQYPGRAAEMKPDERVSGFATSSPKSAGHILRAAFTRLFNKGGASEKKSAIPKAIVKEFYIQDRRKSMEDSGIVPIVQGITKPAKKGLPFPGGRRIIRQGNLILEDSFNPYWDGLYPADMISGKIDLETVWGPDVIQGIKRLQEAINRIGHAYTKTTLLNSVVRVIMDQDALSPTERNKISNQVGQFIEKRLGREVKFEVPSVLPRDVIEFVHQLIALVREQVGVIRNPAMKDLPSIVTGPAIEGLQLMVETPIRTAARRLEALYQRVGQKFISRIFQYYLSDRLLQRVGPNKKWIQFEFVRRNLIIDPKTGAPRTEEDIRKAFQDFRFTVEPGSSLAITRVQRVMSKAFFVKEGWLHPEEVLMEAGIANPEEKLKRAQEARDTGLFQPQDGRKGSGNSLPFGGGGLQ